MYGPTDIAFLGQRGHGVVDRQEIIQQVITGELAGHIPQGRPFQVFHRGEGWVAGDGIQVERRAAGAHLGKGEGGTAAVDPGPVWAFAQQIIHQGLSLLNIGGLLCFSQKGVKR
ncbi:MAG: hypothetical protein HC927_11035 [Deltaproteobacteria bacterium]|nr:hypothetical protein [Deltaproteobacteria bacterium]